MSERRPLNLNQRHNRLLQHLSASRPRNPPPPSSSSDKKSEVKLNDVSEAKESEFCDAEDGSDDPVVEEDADIEEPRFSILSDLDSDTPVKSKADGNEEEAIRDKLNEPSSKMDLLSMERPKMPNKVTPVGYSLDAAGTGAGKQEENSHLLENDGPSPPFHNAFSVNQSIAVKLPTELDVAGTEVGKQKGNARVLDHVGSSASFRNSFDASQSRADKFPTERKDEVVQGSIMGDKYYGGPSKGRSLVFKAPKRSVMKSKQSSAINVDENEDDECKILSRSKFAKGASRHLKTAQDACSSNESCYSESHVSKNVTYF